MGNGVMTEKRCSKCGEMKALSAFGKHTRNRDALQSQCKECMAVWGRAYRAANQEKTTARQKKWREEHREELAAYGKKYRASHVKEKAALDKAYREDHKQEAAAYRKRYRDAHREELVAKRKVYDEARGEEARIYRETHGEEIAARMQAYRQANPEKVAGYKQRRRALKAGATIEPFDQLEVYERDGRQCVYCGSTDDLTLDHVVALADGGAHSLDNLTVACGSCNSSKRATPLIRWLATTNRLDALTQGALL